MFISDIADINPETKTQFDDQEHINYLDTSNITKNFIGDFHSLVVGKDKIPSRAKRKVIDKDFVYSTVRPNNKHFGFLNDPPENLVVSTGFVVIRVDPKKANPRFVYEYLTQDKFTAHMQNIGEDSTSTYPGIKPDDLSSIEIDLPSIKKQDFISAFATKIDNKIKLNQKMNKTLEEIAESLFKSWFIDFDPVRAKAEERPTGLSKEISDLFPDSFEDSELGEIPKGWTTDNISEIVNIEYGKNLPTKKLLDEGFPVFGGNGVIGYFNEYLYEDVMTVIACRGAASGKVIRTLPKSFVTNNSLVLNHLKTNFCYQTYVDLYLRSIDLSIFVTGSAQPQLTIDNLSHLKMIIPSLEILELFQDQAGLLFQKIILNDDSSTNLKNIRDTLLPKLISGELKITDAESLVEEVGI